MISKTADDVVNSYIEDIQKSIPTKAAILIALICSLYFSHTQGKFHSIILSFLSLSPNVLFSDQGLSSLPIYVYSLSTIGALILTTLISRVFSSYLRYVASLQPIRKKIEDILTSGNVRANEILINRKEHLLEEHSEKTRISQKTFTRHTNVGEVAFSLGMISIISSHFGNLLDLAYGVAFCCAGIFFLHKAAFLFINSILIKRAEMRYLLNELSYKESSQSTLEVQPQ